MTTVKAVAAYWINDAEEDTPILSFVQTHGPGGDYRARVHALPEIRLLMKGLPKPVLVDCVITFDEPKSKKRGQKRKQ